MSEGQNGDRFNRQVKATEAYANLARDIKDLRDDLLDDEKGILPRMEAAMNEQRANPVVRLGVFLGTTPRAVGAAAGFAATCVGIGAGIRSLLG